jgi:tripartite-type tricarboxylate transporter receptor subunit TctC
MSKLHTLMRDMVAGAVGVIALVAFSAQAAEYPTQPVKIVVPWAAGGFTDVFGRLIADKLTRSLGQPVIVENKPGASGGIGTEQVARAAPDGYTLILHTSDTLVWSVGMADAYASDPKNNQKPGYDPVRDLTHITLMGTQPVLLLVGSQVPANTLPEFVALAKAKPGAVSYGSSGEGSAVHLAMETFSTQAGIRMIHVPYKGINPALMDVLAGQVQALFLSVQGAGGNLQNGKLKPLGITSLQRSALVPNVPTIAESGYPDFQLTLWYEIAGPKGMPPEVVDKLNRAIKAALAEPDVKEKLQTGNTTIVGSTPSEAQAFVAAEATRWNAAVKNAKAK